MLIPSESGCSLLILPNILQHATPNESEFALETSPDLIQQLYFIESESQKGYLLKVTKLVRDKTRIWNQVFSALSITLLKPLRGWVRGVMQLEFPPIGLRIQSMDIWKAATEIL